jgi:hypothetical protein
LAARNWKRAPSNGAGVPTRAPWHEFASVGVATAVLHAQQLVLTFVEFVVAHRVEVEPEQVHRLDRRLVVEERGIERAAADQVASRHHHAVRRLVAQAAHESRHVIDPARRHRQARARRRAAIDAVDVAAQAEVGAVDVAVEVVEGDHAQAQRAPGVRACGGTGERTRLTTADDASAAPGIDLAGERGHERAMTGVAGALGDGVDDLGVETHAVHRTVGDSACHLASPFPKAHGTATDGR